MTDNAENDLIAGIAPKSVSHDTPSAQKPFKAWHKPRKQWMRRNQWAKEIETLIPQLRLDGRPLRYFSLPGEDMLDIRVLSEICKAKSLKLKCLGFDEDMRNRTSEIEVAISRSELSNNIEPTSIIFADNLTVLKSRDSLGFQRVRDLGPFDVINLDLCGAISCVNYPDNHQVVYNLCEHQIHNSREKWLLFLTTRGEYEQVDTSVLPHYLECLKKNTELSAAFGARLKEMSKWDISGYNSGSQITEALGGCRDIEFVKLFVAGFSKWLLHLCGDTANKWEVKMLDSCWYRVEKNQDPTSFPNMISLAFLFSPVNIPIPDRSGLARENTHPAIDEKSLAMQILEQIERIKDVDQEMDADPETWQRFVEESSDLLGAARYQTAQYAKWAEEKRIHFAPAH